MISALPWTVAISEAVNLGVITNVLQQSFTLPQHLLFATFRVVVPVRAAGDMAVRLRFGFEDADTDVGTQGINFGVIATVNGSETRSVVWGGTTAVPLAAPDFTGNPFSVLPPRVDVFLTTNAVTGFNGTYTVSYAGLIVP